MGSITLGLQVNKKRTFAYIIIIVERMPESLDQDIRSARSAHNMSHNKATAFGVQSTTLVQTTITGSLMQSDTHDISAHVTYSGHPNATEHSHLFPQPGDNRPRCYEHGCGGRPFSSAENYRRHIREKSGSDTVLCLFCGLSFSRKSNRDAHICRGKCKVLNEVHTDSLEALTISQQDQCGIPVQSLSCSNHTSTENQMGLYYTSEDNNIPTTEQCWSMSATPWEQEQQYSDFASKMDTGSK